MDTETGVVVEQRLAHENGEAQRFYAGLKEQALVGIERRGSRGCWPSWGTNWWWGKRPRFGRWKSASRSATGGTPPIY